MHFSMSQCLLQRQNGGKKDGEKEVRRWREGGREERRKDGRKHKSALNLADAGCSSSSGHMMAA